MYTPYLSTNRINFDKAHERVAELDDLFVKHFETHQTPSVSSLDFEGYGDIQAFALNTESISAFFAPTIVHESEEMVTLNEVFTEKPGLYVKIKRPKTIRLRAFTSAGEPATVEYTGLTARAIQHEMDRLCGVNSLSRANSFHKDQALKKYAKYLKYK